MPCTIRPRRDCSNHPSRYPHVFFRRQQLLTAIIGSRMNRIRDACNHLLKRHRTCHAERHFRSSQHHGRNRSNKRNLERQPSGKPASTPFSSSFFTHTALNSRNVFTRNHTTLDFVNKARSLFLARLARGFSTTMAILTAATRLTWTNLCSAFSLTDLRDRFTIGHLRSTDITLNFELTLHPVNDDLEMQFAHPGKDSLTGLFIGPHPQRGILRQQLA